MNHRENCPFLKITRVSFVCRLTPRIFTSFGESVLTMEHSLEALIWLVVAVITESHLKFTRHLYALTHV